MSFHIHRSHNVPFINITLHYIEMEAYSRNSGLDELYNNNSSAWWTLQLARVPVIFLFPRNSSYIFLKKYGATHDASHQSWADHTQGALTIILPGKTWLLTYWFFLKSLKRCLHISYHSLDFVQQKKTKFIMEQSYMLPILYCQYHAC